jgi:hypothetical protein
MHIYILVHHHQQQGVLTENRKGKRATTTTIKQVESKSSWWCCCAWGGAESRQTCCIFFLSSYSFQRKKRKGRMLLRGLVEAEEVVRLFCRYSLTFHECQGGEKERDGVCEPPFLSYPSAQERYRRIDFAPLQEGGRIGARGPVLRAQKLFFLGSPPELLFHSQRLLLLCVSLFSGFNMLLMRVVGLSKISHAQHVHTHAHRHIHKHTPIFFFVRHTHCAVLSYSLPCSCFFSIFFLFALFFFSERSSPCRFSLITKKKERAESLNQLFSKPTPVP